MLDALKAFVEVHPVFVVVALGLLSTSVYMAVQVYGFVKPHPEQAPTEVERGKPVEVTEPVEVKAPEAEHKESQRTDAEDKGVHRDEA